jgi:uncharacterized surface protein with fasciclin (FAS1) repeats
MGSFFIFLSSLFFFFILHPLSFILSTSLFPPHDAALAVFSLSLKWTLHPKRILMANLVETAKQAGLFNTLITALQATDLEETLSTAGPFTVLAPTDQAFDQLPQGELDALLQDPHKLKQILLYHVISGDVRSDDLNEIDEAPTVEGELVAVEQAGDGIRINDSKVLQMDILAENGVIHVIDSVLMPIIMG